MRAGDQNATGRGGHTDRLTVQEAAQRLGISEEAVRGRIKRGTLTSERDGARVWVLVERPVVDESGDQPDDQEAAWIEDLRDQVSYLRDQLQREQDAHAEARRLLAGALERIPALEVGGSPETGARGAERESAGTADPNSRGGSVAHFLPTPADQLPGVTYVLLVLGSAILYLIGTFPMAPVALVTYAPVLFGAWLGIKRRGRPYRIYILAGISVGLLVASFIVTEIVGAEDVQFFRNNPQQVPMNILFWFVSPSLLFTSGALFGDVIKRRAWAQSYSEPTAHLDTTQPAEGLSIRATVIWGVIGTIAAAVITGVFQLAAAVMGGP